MISAFSLLIVTDTVNKLMPNIYPRTKKCQKGNDGVKLICDFVHAVFALVIPQIVGMYSSLLTQCDTMEDFRKQKK